MIDNILIFILVIIVLVIVLGSAAVYRNISGSGANVSFSKSSPPSLNETHTPRKRRYAFKRIMTAEESEKASARRISAREQEIISHHAIPRRRKKRLEKTAEGRGLRGRSSRIRKRARNRLLTAEKLTDVELDLFHHSIKPVNHKQIEAAGKNGKKIKPRYHRGLGAVSGGNGETQHGIGRAGHGTRGHSLRIVHKKETKTPLVVKLIQGAKKK